MDQEKFSYVGTEACLLIIFFRNLRSKKRGQNHKKRTPIPRFFMILTTLFRSQITKKNINKQASVPALENFSRSKFSETGIGFENRTHLRGQIPI